MCRASSAVAGSLPCLSQGQSLRPLSTSETVMRWPFSRSNAGKQLEELLRMRTAWQCLNSLDSSSATPRK
eukprot:4672442-Amphidinium_carterae.1